MRTKIVFPSIIFIAITIISFTYANRISEKGCENKDVSRIIPYSIHCNGIVFDTFPAFDGFENKLFATNLNKITKFDIKKIYNRAPYDPFSNDIQQYIFSSFKNNIEKNEAYFKYNVRLDGEKITWAPVVMLPTNGKFIMIIMVYWEKEAYEPESKGFYLSTFSLKGKMLSMAYINGYEAFDYSNSNNKELLTSIWGRAYCLNTNRPIVRKAVNWDSYRDRGGFRGTNLEVKEIEYFINDEGFIKKENEKIILAKKHVQWKDRAKVTFETGSDTIRKLLGE